MNDFSQFIGQRIAAVKGMEEASDEILFTFESGATARFYHYQDCCETVAVCEVVGDVDDLIGQVLLSFEEAISDVPESERCNESGTWTFYIYRTLAGTVTVRWLGDSNGYYSEGVDLEVKL